MTVAAIDAQAGDVVLMAEWDRLRLANAGVSYERGTLNRVSDPN